MTEWKLPWDGGCRCGQTRIRVSQPPLLAAACHCTGCQRMSASAFSLTLAIPSEGFDVTARQSGHWRVARAHTPLFLSALYELDVYAS